MKETYWEYLLDEGTDNIATYTLNCPTTAESLDFLKKKIEEDLACTGKKYYERIAESLDLMKRINPGRSQRIADEIHANFKKRSSLIQIIQGFWSGCELWNSILGLLVRLKQGQ